MWVYSSGTIRAVYEKGWANRIGTALVKRHARVAETQLPINHGDSGGPVVNDRCELVAVVTGGRDRDHLGLVRLMTYHVHADEVRAFVGRAMRLLAPRGAADCNQRGLSYSRRGLHDRAIADFTAALRLDPLRFRLLQPRPVLQREGRPGHRPCRLHPRPGDQRRPRPLLLRSGAGLPARGALARAVAEYTRAIQCSPGCAVYYNNRGHAYYGWGKFARAIVDYNEAVRLDPSYSFAYNNRGHAHLAAGQPGQALDDYLKADAHGYPFPAVILTNAATAALRLKDCGRAVKLSAAAVKWYPTMPPVTSSGAAYEEQGAASRPVPTTRRPPGRTRLRETGPLQHEVTIQVANEAGQPVRIAPATRPWSGTAGSGCPPGRRLRYSSTPSRPARPRSWPSREAGCRRRVILWAEGTRTGRRFGQPGAVRRIGPPGPSSCAAAGGDPANRLSGAAGG